MRIEGPNLILEPNWAQAIAVTLHELATNAAKYGALSVAHGSIQVEWARRAQSEVLLRWSETDGPAVTTPTDRGFGTRVMESMIAQLGGTIRFAWRPSGLLCEINMPV